MIRREHRRCVSATSQGLPGLIGGDAALCPDERGEVPGKVGVAMPIRYWHGQGASTHGPMRRAATGARNWPSEAVRPKDLDQLASRDRARMAHTRSGCGQLDSFYLGEVVVATFELEQSPIDQHIAQRTQARSGVVSIRPYTPKLRHRGKRPAIFHLHHTGAMHGSVDVVVQSSLRGR